MLEARCRLAWCWFLPSFAGLYVQHLVSPQGCRAPAWGLLSSLLSPKLWQHQHPPSRACSSPGLSHAMRCLLSAALPVEQFVRRLVWLVLCKLWKCLFGLN